MSNMKEISYKGYTIHAMPLQLRDTGRWNMEIQISKHTGADVNIKPFSAANTFETEEEAIRNCLNFGIQIVDGKAKNCTVSDL